MKLLNLTIISIFLLSSAVFATDNTSFHVFNSGETISSSKMNENFQRTQTTMDNVDTRFKSVEDNITQLNQQISSLEIVEDQNSIIIGNTKIIWGIAITQMTDKNFATIYFTIPFSSEPSISVVTRNENNLEGYYYDYNAICNINQCKIYSSTYNNIEYYYTIIGNL